MNDSRDFKDAESVRSGQSHVTSQLAFFQPFRDPGGMLSRSFSRNARAATIGRQVLGTRMVYRETFLQIQRRLFQHLIRKSSILGFLMRQNIHHLMWWVKAKHQFRIRDASQDRQPEIHSSPVREDSQRIMGQTNDDCRFRIFILTNSRSQQHLLVGRYDSRQRYVLVYNFLRKLCYGSKKWRRLNQWMISNLRVLSEELKHQILRYSTRKLLQHWTESSIIPASRKRSVWRNKKPKKTIGFFVEDRSLTWSTSTSGSQEPTILSRIMPTYLNCSSKWWYSGIRFEVGRNVIINDKNPVWWHLGRIVQIKNTRVWETQDRIAIVQYGDSSE